MNLTLSSRNLDFLQMEEKKTYVKIIFPKLLQTETKFGNGKTIMCLGIFPWENVMFFQAY